MKKIIGFITALLLPLSCAFTFAGSAQAATAYAHNPPTGLHVTASSYDSLSVAWNHTVGETSYTARLIQLNGVVVSSEVVHSASAQWVPHAGWQYDVQVWANPAKSGGPNDEIKVTIPAAPVAPTVAITGASFTQDQPVYTDTNQDFVTINDSVVFHQSTTATIELLSSGAAGPVVTIPSATYPAGTSSPAIPAVVESPGELITYTVEVIGSNGTVIATSAPESYTTSQFPHVPYLAIASITDSSSGYVVTAVVNTFGADGIDGPWLYVDGVRNSAVTYSIIPADGMVTITYTPLGLTGQSGVSAGPHVFTIVAGLYGGVQTVTSSPFTYTIGS